MEIPMINKSKRVREYNLYTKEQHLAVVKAYLFDGMSHRQIDEQILKLKADDSRGYQAMSILHRLGLKSDFKGIFSDCSVEEAIQELKHKQETSYAELISILESEEINVQDIIDDIDSESDKECIIEREGREITISLTKYERNPLLRKKAIEIHGTKCMICGFDFFETYGERGRGYIEVHHINPLFISKEADVSAEKDLVVICANCHRMIHRKRNQILSVEELKSLLRNKK